MIEARQLSKTFQSRRRGPLVAVDRLSFTCRPGEIYGLLGANGAGKTTTLRMLATILRPTGGTAMLAGYDVAREPAKVRAQIGFLSTATALYGRLTAKELVAYFGRLNGLSESDLNRRADALFEEFEMAGFQHRRCDELSTGMKQKVSIVRTLIHDPPIVILDEPTLGLDVLAARTIIKFIRRCRREEKTVVFSTHVMSEAQKLCDRIGIIHAGALRAEGTLEELSASYGNNDLEEIFLAVVGGSS